MKLLFPHRRGDSVDKLTASSDAMTCSSRSCFQGLALSGRLVLWSSSFMSLCTLPRWLIRAACSFTGPQRALHTSLSCGWPEVSLGL